MKKLFFFYILFAVSVFITQVVIAETKPNKLPEENPAEGAIVVPKSSELPYPAEELEENDAAKSTIQGEDGKSE